MTSDAHSLVERTAQHLRRPIENFVRTRARLHLLDWLGCVAGARQSEIGAIQRRQSGIGAAHKAAWLGNVLEMDDVHRAALLHPGPVIWPAVLSVGDDSLADALDAAICGYEAMIAIGSTFDSRHYAYWHNTATAGAFGAAAAAAVRLDANADQLVAALGLAGSVTGGLWQMRHEPVTAKQWHLAHSVATGRAAAEQSLAGVTGPRLILEGPQGLHAATCADPNPLALADGWQIFDVSFKPWGACRHAHPAIDAALELKARGGLDGAILVSTYRDALVFCDRPDPQTVIEAKFSLQHAVAIVMERGAPQLADFEPDAIAALAPARARVRVAEDLQFSRNFPGHFGARVASGTQMVSLADARGDPERPLSSEGMVGKARALMAWGGVEDHAAEDAIATVLEGDRLSDIVRVLEGWL